MEITCAGTPTKENVVRISLLAYSDCLKKYFALASNNGQKLCHVNLLASFKSSNEIIAIGGVARLQKPTIWTVLIFF